ncbi:unnamed protein product [Arctogadus glacialis]
MIQQLPIRIAIACSTEVHDRPGLAARPLQTAVLSLPGSQLACTFPELWDGTRSQRRLRNTSSPVPTEPPMYTHTLTGFLQLSWLSKDGLIPVPVVLREISNIMTKLLEWVFGVSVVGAAWAFVTFDILKMSIPRTYREVAWPMPLYLLVTFGCYSLATVGYRVATFNDCDDAAKELQAQIIEAREDLRKKGLKF